jgi:hypothetical protein
MRRLALLLVLGVTTTVVTPAGAVTSEWHTVEPCAKGAAHCPWYPTGEFAPRLEVKGNTQALEAALAQTLYGEAAEHAGKKGEWTAAGQQPNLSAVDHGFEAADGWWCRAGEIYAPGAIFTIPNPSGKPSGWWDTPQCRSMTVGPDGAHWFTDPGTESVGRVASNGAVTEYPLPAVPSTAQGYPRDAYPTPAAIATVGSELWVASSSGEGMYSVNPSGTPTHAARAASRHRHHRRAAIARA